MKKHTMLLVALILSAFITTSTFAAVSLDEAKAELSNQARLAKEHNDGGNASAFNAALNEISGEGSVLLPETLPRLKTALNNAASAGREKLTEALQMAIATIEKRTVSDAPTTVHESHPGRVDRCNTLITDVDGKATLCGKPKGEHVVIGDTAFCPQDRCRGCQKVFKAHHMQADGLHCSPPNTEFKVAMITTGTTVVRQVAPPVPDMVRPKASMKEETVTTVVEKTTVVTPPAPTPAPKKGSSIKITRPAPTPVPAHTAK